MSSSLKLCSCHSSLRHPQFSSESFKPFSSIFCFCHSSLRHCELSSESSFSLFQFSPEFCSQF
ncbi:MAG: hypothetical protein LBQ59_01405 [Candidatus Peribacteria bacterium]|nr:hypothetical protein [Candidatus Peribacteria bacterium]